MTAHEATDIVSSMRRHILLARVARGLMIGVVALAFVGALVPAEASAQRERLLAPAMLAALAWLSATMLSARQIRAAAQASVYITSGRLDLAEERLKHALRQFSLYRTGKLIACHNLAVVAHGQRNYRAAAALCDGLVAAGLGTTRNIGRMCRILLADCRLFLGETFAAVQAIASMNSGDAQLSLAERIMLLPIELRCQVAQGRFDAAAESLAGKVRLAELMESPRAALVHALLAQACRATGRTESAEFLRDRAMLYHDLGELSEEYQLDLDSAPTAPIADNSRVS